jgi:hypothetical protein
MPPPPEDGGEAPAKLAFDATAPEYLVRCIHADQFWQMCAHDSFSQTSTGFYKSPCVRLGWKRQKNPCLTYLSASTFLEVDEAGRGLANLARLVHEAGLNRKVFKFSILLPLNMLVPERFRGYLNHRMSHNLQGFWAETPLN